MIKEPMNPAHYVPSDQARRIMKMIIDHRYTETSSWVDKSERRFNDGTRYGLSLAFRALVELETNITDPDDLDVLCADLLWEETESRS